MSAKHFAMRPNRVGTGIVKTAVVVSPALRYGSWGWLEDIIALNPEINWIVIAYGRPVKERLSHVEWWTWKMGNYQKIGRIASKRYLLWINFLYAMPLALVALFVVWFRDADVVVGNGIAATGLLSPCRYFRSTKIWLAYHGYVSWLSGSSQRLARSFLSKIDGAICNSSGSANDLTQVMPTRPVIAVEHWADDVFFSNPLKADRQDGFLRVLYVGRTDLEKFAQCGRVLRQLIKEGIAELTVVGSAHEHHADDGILYVDYVTTRERLANFYRWADLVWAPADVDYLSRPGIEALACGCPVIVSDIPAVSEKDSGEIRIPRELVEDGLGWVVDGSDDGEVLTLLRRLAQGHEVVGDPQKCRTYAKEHHSSKNIEIIARTWFGNQ